MTTGREMNEQLLNVTRMEVAFSGDGPNNGKILSGGKIHGSKWLETPTNDKEL